MAVAHLASSESHAGTTGSASEGLFSWTHVPGGTPRGVIVFTFVNAAADDALSVTYGGVALTAVIGGRAVDTTTDPGDCKAWFLGASVPTGNQTVEVTRTNNANVMYAVALTVSALTDTDIYEAGIVLDQEDGTLAQASVTDNSPGTNSTRYAGLNSGLNAVPTAGADTGGLQTIDFGSRICVTARRNNAGQGSLGVGWSSGATDSRAAVYLAVREPPAIDDEGCAMSLAATRATLSYDTLTHIAPVVCTEQ